MTAIETRLEAPDWMNAPATRKLCRALESGGHAVRFVGGAVRDGLLGREPAEIDLATSATPEQVIAALKKAGLKPLPTGLEHGTITTSFDGRAFEITTLRVDVKTDGRHAQVAFTEDWQADAARRDFTFNALYADRDGTLHDPAGGLADLRAGRVRFIGDPNRRIGEDYLRILRFFRFFAAYGRGEADPAALAACAAHISGLQRLSGERIRNELLKLLAAPRGPAAVRLMAACGIWDALMPAAARIDRYEGLRRLEDEHFFTPDPVLALAAFFDGHAAAQPALDRLKLPKAHSSRIRAVLEDRSKIVSYLAMRQTRRLLYQLGPELFTDRVFLEWALEKKPANAVQWRALLAMAQAWEKPRFPLTGHMVQSAGVPPGPETGRVMREVEEWWIDADFTDDKFSLIERLKAVVQATVY